MPPPGPHESAGGHGRPGPRDTSTSVSASEQDGHGAAFVLIKPPLPTLPTSASRHANAIEVQLPPLIAGALVAAFAATIADGLGNQLLTHYYLSDEVQAAVRPNLDRAIDRLLVGFAEQLWDELFDFYRASNAQFARQVAMLFDGPVRQLILIINGPELARCLLERIGPGLSRRPITWSETAKGIDLSLAMQLVCGFWHREFPALSPGGNPDEIARTIVQYLTDGRAFKNLVANLQHTLVGPHYVQMILMESAVWDIAMKRGQGQGQAPPVDGFHIMQFRFECHLFERLDAAGDISQSGIDQLRALTGTASDCVGTTVSEYVERRWHRCGRILQRCLSEALVGALESFRQGQPCEGMSVWDGSAEQSLYPGLRLVHVEAEPGTLRLSVSAWTPVLVEVLQQMAWTCAALTAPPFPDGVAECAMRIASWEQLNGSTYVNCSLTHRLVPDNEVTPALQQRRGVSIASGFPLEGSSSLT
jgi:hypothetical protein